MQSDYSRFQDGKRRAGPTLLWFWALIYTIRTTVYVILLTGLAALVFPFTHAQQTPDQLPFITTWKTDTANRPSPSLWCIPATQGNSGVDNYYLASP